jgi:hypothetical protein
MSKVPRYSRSTDELIKSINRMNTGDTKLLVFLDYDYKDGEARPLFFIKVKYGKDKHIRHVIIYDQYTHIHEATLTVPKTRNCMHGGTEMYAETCKFFQLYYAEHKYRGFLKKVTSKYMTIHWNDFIGKRHATRIEVTNLFEMRPVRANDNELPMSAGKNPEYIFPNEKLSTGYYISPTLLTEMWEHRFGRTFSMGLR